MKDYTLSSSSIMYANGSSDGTQVKFCERGKWFKQDLRGYEGEVEYIVSCLSYLSKKTPSKSLIQAGMNCYFL